VESSNTFKISGTFDVECYDKNGNLKWQSIAKNAATSYGLNSLLDNYFRQSAVGSIILLDGWAIGLISAGDVELSAGDTHFSHSGWEEFTNYEIDGDDTIRPEWITGPAAAQQLANITIMDFDIISSGRITGVFIVGGTITVPPDTDDANLKDSNDPTPLLWAHALLSSEQNVVNGDQVRISYQISATSS